MLLLSPFCLTCIRAPSPKTSSWRGCETASSHKEICGVRKRWKPPESGHCQRGIDREHFFGTTVLLWMNFPWWGIPRSISSCFKSKPTGQPPFRRLPERRRTQTYTQIIYIYICIYTMYTLYTSCWCRVSKEIHTALDRALCSFPMERVL